MAHAKRDQLKTMFNDPRVPWIDMEGETKRLDVETYRERYRACPFFPRLRAGSKTSGTVRIQPLTLVQHLMHQVKWRDLFTCIMADELPYIPEREQRHAVIGSETKEERIELEASFQVLSPLVPLIESKFTRTCHQMETLGEWLVFDLPTNGQDQWPYVRACLVRNSGDESSNVTWIVLGNFQVKADIIYRGLLESGRGFGSMRWFETLARECRRQHTYNPNVLQGLKGRTKNVPGLAQRMTRNFCLGIAWATPHRFSSRIYREPMDGVSFGTALKYDGEEGDNYVTAAMSARVKGSYNDVFDHIKSLRPLGRRIVQIPSHETDDHVGLYSPDPDDDMFIKESLKDASGAIWVYAPITNKILTKTIKKKTKKNDSVLDSFGYVVCPDGLNHSFSLVTIASQLNISDNNLNCPVGFEEMARDDMVTYWEKTASAEILADFTNILNHFAAA